MMSVGAMSRDRRRASAAPAGLDNAAAARHLRELAARLELEGVPHGPRAYRRAADTVERERRSVAAIRAEEGARGLEALPAVGPQIARTLCELLDTGAIARLERLRQRTQVDVVSLLSIDGIGPKRLKTLWEELRVRTVQDLEHAVAHKSVQALPGFGVRSEERLRQVLRVRQCGAGRMPLKEAAAIAERLREQLERHPKVSRCSVAGSIRRGLSTVGDIDLVVASDDAPAVAQAFLARPDIALVYAKGPQRVSVALESSIDVDLRIVSPACFGSALLYLTGSRVHTVALRRLALAQGLRLNEYGLFRGKHRIAGEEEEEVYVALSLPYLPPGERLGGTEIRSALQEARGSDR
jgi:DNA polymerase (family 10)